jgi:hypothetical protein
VARLWLRRAQPARALEELVMRPGERPPVEELTAIGRRLVEQVARNGEAMRLLLWEARAQPDLAARAAPVVRRWDGGFIRRCRRCGGAALWPRSGQRRGPVPGQMKSGWRGKVSCPSDRPYLRSSASSADNTSLVSLRSVASNAARIAALGG